MTLSAVTYVCPKTSLKFYLWQIKDEIISWNLNRSCAKRLTQNEASDAVIRLRALADYDGVRHEEWMVEEL